MNKVIVIYHDEQLIENYLNSLIEYSDSIKYATKFTSDQNDDNLLYYMSTIDVKIALKNNALLYIITRDYISTGITMDEFYNTDICFLHYDEYNEIADIIFKKYNILTVWIDSPIDKKLWNQKMSNDLTFVEQRLENVPNEYFYNDDFDVINNVICNFLYSNEKDEEES